MAQALYVVTSGVISSRNATGPWSSSSPGGLVKKAKSSYDTSSGGVMYSSSDGAGIYVASAYNVISLASAHNIII